MRDEFWAKVDTSGECWLWTGAVAKRSGYGQFQRNTLAHRLSWEIANGPIPSGLLVCHRCDVRLCVRPDHLFLGTIADNNRDMWAKGRGRHARFPGESHPMHVLTEDDVREIRASQGFTRAQLATRFGLTATAIGNVLLRKSWRHVL